MEALNPLINFLANGGGGFKYFFAAIYLAPPLLFQIPMERGFKLSWPQYIETPYSSNFQFKGVQNIMAAK